MSASKAGLLSVILLASRQYLDTLVHRRLILHDKGCDAYQLASACAMLCNCLDGLIACQILHFLGMLTYGGEPGMRRLGLQCMWEMANSSLEQPCDDLVWSKHSSHIALSSINRSVVCSGASVVWSTEFSTTQSPGDGEVLMVSVSYLVHQLSGRRHWLCS